MRPPGGGSAIDTVARGLASGMSRREALRAGGAALVGTVALTPSDAWAAISGSCPTGRVSCHGTCCPSGEVCLPRSSSIPRPHCGCRSGQTRCNGQCVHLATNHQNCGRCGHACSAGQVCRSSKCVTPCGTTGATCTFGSCCTGGVCDQSTHKCVAQPPCIGTACTSTCCTGTVCDNVHAVNPACRMPTGAPCNVDNDCGVQDYCAAGVCTTGTSMRRSGAYCDDGDDCLSSLTCDTTNNVCCAGQSQACPAGVQCCAGFTCVQGTCASCLSEGTACSGQTPCCSGLTCTGGVCTAPCIKSGGDCSSRPNDCCSGLVCGGGGTCKPI